MNGQHEDPAPGDERSPLQKLERHILGRLGRGILVLIPLIVTLIIVSYSIGFFISLLEPFIDGLMGAPFIEDIPAIGIIAWVVLVAVGFGTFYFIGALVLAGSRRRVVQLQSALLSRIPVVKSIYGVVRQATDALSTSQQHSFSRVVFLEWPRPGIRAMGFVTGHCHLPADDQTMLVVYIPTVPNPTSGMLAILSENEVTDTDITVEEAMKVVFSGGIVLPEAMRFGPYLTPRQPKPGATLEPSIEDRSE